MGQSGFNEHQNPLPLPQQHKNCLVSRLCPRPCCGETEKLSQTAASCEKEPGLQRTRTSCFLTMCR